IEGVREHSSLVTNSRIPQPVGHAWGTGGGAVAHRVPIPAHGITRMDRHRIRIEAEAVVIADNRDCDRGGTCRPLAANQKRSANHHDRYRAECNGVHRISQTVQLQPICCFTQQRKSNTIVTVDSVSRASYMPEYDFAKGVRGKRVLRYAQGSNVVVLDPDVA